MIAHASSYRRMFSVLLSLLACFAAQIAVAQFDAFEGLSGLGGDDGSTEVSISAELIPSKDDSPAQLAITADIPEGFHVFAIDQGALPNNGGGPMATEITINPESPVKLLGNWQPSEPPHVHIDQEAWVGLELREHEQQITWTVPVEVTGGGAITGLVRGQSCNPNTCIPFRQEINITASLGTAASGSTAANVSPQSPSHSIEIGSQSATNVSGYDISKIELNDSTEQSIWYYLVSAFFGGIILNIMPCVLPVIGLKVMSFVQQAGQSRAQAWVLNCWYSAGIIIVFLILASLAVSLQLGWGGQFGNAGFNLTLIAIVFAMALSLLGVWDIPIPGFVGGSKATMAAEREGPAAAFLKGVLTTILATPCTGPLMAAALAWAVKQPAWVTFSVFGTLGLGMASPYLLIGAFPSLVNFLPKPGPWMETFKKVTGFILLATVVWLMSFIDSALLVPTALMLLGISIACWWVSKTPITASRLQKTYAWATAGLLTVVSALLSYGILQPIMEERFEEEVAAHSARQVELKSQEIAQQLANVDSLDQLQGIISEFAKASTKDTGKPWQPFTNDKLSRIALSEGRTVMVDFTADWCVSCKALEKYVLKTEPVEQAIDAADVVTMEADYTDEPPEMKEMIKALGGIGVPLVAIFPASNPYQPIVFSNGQYTQQDLIDGITQATGQRIAPVADGNATQTSLSQVADPEPRL